MLAKILGSASTAFDAVKYHYDKKDIQTGELLLVKNFPTPIDLSSSPELIKKHLREVSSRSRSKQPQFHLTLSGKFHSYSKKDFLSVAQKLMENMGYQKQPYLIIFHKDTPNRHVHIVSTRVDVEKGILLPTFNEIYKVSSSLNKAMEEIYGFSYEEKAKDLLSYKVSSFEHLYPLIERENLRMYRSKKKGTFTILRKLSAIHYFKEEDIVLSPVKDTKRLEELFQQFEKFKELYSSKVFAIDLQQYNRKVPTLKILERTKTSYVSELSFKMKELFSVDLVLKKVEESPFLEAVLIDHKQKMVFPKEETRKIVNLFTLTDERIEKNLFDSLNNYGISSEREKKLLIEVYKDPSIKDFMIFPSAQRKPSSLYKEIQKEVGAYIGNPLLPGIQIIKSKEDGLDYAVHMRSHYLEPLQTLVGPKLYEKYQQRVAAGAFLAQIEATNLNSQNPVEDFSESSIEQSFQESPLQTSEKSKEANALEVSKQRLSQESASQNGFPDELQKRKRKRPVV